MSFGPEMRVTDPLKAMQSQKYFIFGLFELSDSCGAGVDLWGFAGERGG